VPDIGVIGSVNVPSAWQCNWISIAKGVGTEVQLTLPASVAYDMSAIRRTRRRRIEIRSATIHHLIISSSRLGRGSAYPCAARFDSKEQTSASVVCSKVAIKAAYGVKGPRCSGTDNVVGLVPQVVAGALSCHRNCNHHFTYPGRIARTAPACWPRWRARRLPGWRSGPRSVPVNGHSGKHVPSLDLLAFLFGCCVHYLFRMPEFMDDCRIEGHYPSAATAPIANSAHPGTPSFANDYDIEWEVQSERNFVSDRDAPTRQAKDDFHPGHHARLPKPGLRAPILVRHLCDPERALLART